MTATNHALTGALIASVIREPLVAIPAAFAAHFVMDTIPHFGLNHKDVFSRNDDRWFKLVLIGDVLIAVVLLVVIPLLLHPMLPILLTLSCMIACMSPDLVWGWHFYHEVRYKTIKSKTWFSKVHKKIQWSETIHGALTEIVWFTAFLTIIILRK